MKFSDNISTEWINVFFTFCPWITIFCLIYGLFIDTAYIWAGIIYYTFLIPIIDYVMIYLFGTIGLNEGPNSKPITKAQKFMYEFSVFTYLHFYFIVVLLTAYAFSINSYSLLEYAGIIFLWGIYGLDTLSTFHEFLHRRSKYLRFIGRLGMAVGQFTLFAIEHLFMHHSNKLFLSNIDYERARYRSTLYEFLYRGVYSFHVNVFRSEKKRLEKSGKPAFWFTNKAYTLVVFQSLPIIVLSLIFGLKAGLLVFACVTMGSIRFYTYGYTSHYAVARQHDPETGKMLPANEASAWDDNRPFFKYYSFGGARHNYHHAAPTDHYYTYTKKPTGPLRLVFGPTASLITHIFCPWLFFYVMDKVMDKITDVEFNREKVWELDDGTIEYRW